MVEWYEAYADYTDTMARIEELVETVARETIGTTQVTFRGHEVDLKAPWRRLKLLDALEENGLWTRDEDELRRRLAAGRGAGARPRPAAGRASSPMRCRTSSSRASSSRRSCTITRSSSRRSRVPLT